MSIANFRPTLWSARVQANLDKALVLARLCNRDYEGEVRAFGDQVRINKPGDVAVTTGYTAGTTITYGTPFSVQQTLSINQRSLAAFRADDVDELQANIDVVETYAQRMGYSLADDIDRAIAGEFANAGAGNVALNVSGAVTAGDLVNAFAQAGQLLDTTNTPSVGRWAAISPATHAAMARDSRIFTGLNTADAVLNRGQNYIGEFMGFALYKTNNLLGTGVTVTLTAQANQNATTLACSALSAGIPANTILTFGPGRYARTTAAAVATATSITVAPLTVVLASGSVATYVTVRRCLFGTNDAITLAVQLTPTVEALRDRDTTEDFVRAQQVYGFRTIEPMALGTLTVTEA